MFEDDRHSDRKFRTQDKRRLDVYESFGERLKKSLRVDLRYSVLDFHFGSRRPRTQENLLHIYTDSVTNAIRISRAYEKMFHDVPNSAHRSFKIRVVLLPDRSVGNFKKGICHVGVAAVRKSNDSSSEQVTQVLYGEGFDTLQYLGNWLRIRLHADGYIGWVSSNQVTLFTQKEFDKYQSLPKVIVVEKVLPFFEKPDTHSVALREAVVGTQLAVMGNHKSFLEVRLPDGLCAYVEKSGISLSSPKKRYSRKNLLETARNFQGTSYVWGGRSAKGFDCSGFVQTVFRLSGIELPRDADLQFSAGEFIGKAFNRMRQGDLLFFSSKGDKINHVGIFLGRHTEFIHSSGFVRINSLDPRRKNFNKRLFSCFVGACRVI